MTTCRKALITKIQVMMNRRLPHSSIEIEMDKHAMKQWQILDTASISRNLALVTTLNISCYSKTIKRNTLRNIWKM